jgi:hypothetical protein
VSRFVVQITPLIRPDPGFVDPDDIVEVAQFADLDVGHAINGFKTAKVTLSMFDPVVADLEAFKFALRVLYEDRQEPIFWGQSNLIKDYDAGVVHLEAQDPSWRMLHHYLRRGDDAINGADGDVDKGTINADAGGLELVVAAAQNIASQDARNDPSLAVDIVNAASIGTGPAVVVERGQECWQEITDIADNELGPELSMDTPDTLDFYAHLTTYDLLGTDRTSATPDTPAAGEVVFDFGLGADNIETGPTVTPIPPVTHAHVLSEDRTERRTAVAKDAGGVPTSNMFGVWVRFLRTSFNVSGGDTSVLFEKAKAICRAYGFPLRQMSFALRPDVALGHSYGRPGFSAPPGTRVATFYMGDFITVRAQRGYCTDIEDVRVTEAHWTWPGWQGPARTVLTVIPREGAASDDPGGDDS